MGWVWKDNENTTSGSANEFIAGFGDSPPSGGGCSTRKMVTSNCRTEEVEPGKFIRKCEKTQKLLKDCAGRPTEVVESNKEYAEEDVTGQMVRGSFPIDSSKHGPFKFPDLRGGLHSDLEAIERSIFGSMKDFFDAAEEMKRGFFKAFGTPRLYDTDSPPSSSNRRGKPIEAPPSIKLPQLNRAIPMEILIFPGWPKMFKSRSLFSHVSCLFNCWQDKFSFRTCYYPSLVS